MNANLIQLCGKRQVKGAGGARGMSLPSLREYLDSTKVPAFVKAQFTLLKNKDRPALCKLLKTFAAGRELLGYSSPKPSRNGNNNSGNNRMSDSGNNSNSDMFGNARITGYVRPSRTKAKDPFGGKMRLPPGENARLKARMRKMAKKGTLPSFNNRESLLKFMYLTRPQNVRKTKRPCTACGAKAPTAMKFKKTSGGNSTARIRTQPNKPGISRRTKKRRATKAVSPRPAFNMLRPAAAPRNVVRGVTAKKNKAKNNGTRYRPTAGERIAKRLTGGSFNRTNDNRAKEARNRKTAKALQARREKNSGLNKSMSKLTIGKKRSRSPVSNLATVMNKLDITASTPKRTRGENVTPETLAMIMANLATLRSVNESGQRGSSMAKGKGPLRHLLEIL